MRKRALSLLLALTLICALLPTVGLSALAAPSDLTRAGVFSFADGNIARDPAIIAAGYQPIASGGPANVGIYANYTNETYNSARAISLPRLYDGAVAGSSTNQGLAMNTWGSSAGACDGGAYPVWFSMTWPTPRTIDATRVMWWTDNNSGALNTSSSGYGVNGKARLQYWTGTDWANVPNQKDARTGNSVTTLPSAFGTYNSSGVLAASTYNTAWNVVTFPAITTTRLRIVLGSHQNSSNYSSAGNQCGISEWEVFGVADPLDGALAWIKNQLNLTNLVSNVTLPTVYPADTSISFSYESSNTAVLGNNGTVTRPVIGQPNANGTLTVTATSDIGSKNVTLDWSVKAILSDADIVAADLAGINLGDTTDRKISFTLPPAGPEGSAITWSAGNSPYLWDDGTVIRPPSGSAATVTLTATATSGAVSDSRVWTVTIPAYVVGGRTIASFHKNSTAPADVINIEVPVGTCPKLPYRVWVKYTDGYGEWRSTMWPWQGASSPSYGPTGSGTPSNIEDQWKAKAVGAEYTVTGWITGDNATSLGYPITVNCKVVSGGPIVPSNKVVADTLTPGKVTITGENRLSSNAKASVARTCSYSPDTYLWNYRDTFGLQQPSPVTQPSGWEDKNTMLRGSGVGHYLSSLALAYASNLATPAQQTTLKNNTRYMIETMREIQEMTFVQVPADHPNSVANGGSGYREGSNIWPYYPADKATMAPDWPYPLLSEITVASKASSPGTRDNGTYAILRGKYWLASQIPADGRPKTGSTSSPTGGVSPNGASFEIASEKGHPEWFGYGYINAIPPQHPALNEAYRNYADWLWAPYYGIHKQLAGLMEVYYVFNGNPEMQDVADTALLICKDLAHWISERLTTKARVENTRDCSYYGNMNYTWYVNISGEYGGANEAIARCAYALPDSDPDKELLIRGSEMFNNKSYWDPLIVNSEIMSLSSNSHANSRIPNFPGVLWSYRGNADPTYFTRAKNFFDFNLARYRYFTGNVGTGEWYKTPYTQIATIATNGNETCCAYNLSRLAKDLACFDPDNAEYMDELERLQFNQLAGSLRQSSWTVTYQYYLGPQAGGDWRGGTPGADCCGGTGAENHVRYADATYLVNDSAIWVNLYMPTTVEYDAAGVIVKQECEWPAEYSKITVERNSESAKSFDMHLRVPYWATKGFDIKVNGVSFAPSYAPSSYVVLTGVKVGDVIEVYCPYVASLDYAPDKSNNSWAAVVFYGPMALAGTGSWSTINVESDLSNIKLNGTTNFADTNANTIGNNKNVYTASLTGTQPTTNASNLRASWYVCGLQSSGVTHYFRVNMSVGSVDKTALYNKLQEARTFSADDYSEEMFAPVLAAIAGGVTVYQNDAASVAQVKAAVDAIDAALLGLTAWDKDLLQSLITAALGRKADQEAYLAQPVGDAPWAPYGYARMLAALTAGQAVYADAAATQGAVDAAADTLKDVLDTMRIGSMDEVEDLADLKVLLAQAQAIDPDRYTAETYAGLLAAISEAQGVIEAVTAGTSTSRGQIPEAEEALTDAMDALVINVELVDVTMYVGKTYALDLPFDDVDYSYGITTSSVCTIDENGVITAVGLGTTPYTVFCEYDEGKETLLEANITVLTTKALYDAIAAAELLDPTAYTNFGILAAPLAAANAIKNGTVSPTVAEYTTALANLNNAMGDLSYVPVEEVVLKAPSSVKVARNKTVNLALNWTPANIELVLSLTMSNPAIATAQVEEAGFGSANIAIKGVKAGNAILTIKEEADGTMVSVIVQVS